MECVIHAPIMNAATANAFWACGSTSSGANHTRIGTTIVRMTATLVLSPLLGRTSCAARGAAGSLTVCSVMQLMFGGWRGSVPSLPFPASRFPAHALGIGSWTLETDNTLEEQLHPQLHLPGRRHQRGDAARARY